MNLKIDWVDLEKKHSEFKERLKALAYNRKELGHKFETLVRERKIEGQSYKTMRKKIRKLLPQIKKISSQIDIYRKAWLEKGGTEKNFWLHKKANEALAEFQELKEQKDEVSLDKLKELKNKHVRKHTECIAAGNRIRNNKSSYRATQRQMDENSTIRFIYSYTETPTMDVELFVEFKRIQLSIRRQTYRDTGIIKGYILRTDGWFLLDRQGAVDRQCTRLEERFIEDAVNKHK